PDEHRAVDDVPLLRFKHEPLLIRATTKPGGSAARLFSPRCPNARSSLTSPQPLNDTRSASRFALDKFVAFDRFWRLYNEASVERRGSGGGGRDRHADMGASPLHPAEQ